MSRAARELVSKCWNAVALERVMRLIAQGADDAFGQGR